MKKLILIAGILVSFLNSCDKKVSENNVTNDSAKTENSNPAANPIPEDKPVETASENVLQSKSLNGYTVNLTKAKVVGNLISVDLKIDNKDSKVINFNVPLDAIYYIDDTTNKQVKLLKDDQGKYLANPVNSDGSRLYVLGSTVNYLINLKFSLPSEETKTISINIPEMGSFDEIPVSR